MGFLKAKSEDNISSAKELIELKYYGSSVHCSYYGSFQYMKFALRKYKNTSYEKIEADCLGHRSGTHGYIYDNILLALRSKIQDSRDYVYIKRIAKDLKTFRINSDYFNIKISLDDAEKSIKFSEEIITSIKKNIP
ncbi:MAG TPA: HEPN domain-containing protein [Flavobacterium sp.]|nr:HEPN domain-containing protein [Flavobacterium sp.]